uniref:Uncharacterized protein n=1 Tax=Anguilla anguilla TaxID=7936 RepID=A0A0E9VXZ9_ANGAN
MIFMHTVCIWKYTEMLSELYIISV